MASLHDGVLQGDVYHAAPTYADHPQVLDQVNLIVVQDRERLGAKVAGEGGDFDGLQDTWWVGQG